MKLHWSACLLALTACDNREPARSSSDEESRRLKTRAHYQQLDLDYRPPGRYEISREPGSSLVMLVDTVTGDTWELAGGGWRPVDLKRRSTNAFLDFSSNALPSKTTR